MAEHDPGSIRAPASQIWYIDANNLYGYAIIQKLPYKDFEYCSTFLDPRSSFLDNGDTVFRHILITPDDSDNGYYIVCDNKFTINGKDRTEQLALVPK